MKYNPSKLKKYIKVKVVLRPQNYENLLYLKITIKYQNNEGNQNLKLSKLPKTAWLIQKLALNYLM